MSTEYTLEIRLRADVPTDVLVEHIAVALRKIVDPAKRDADRSSVRIKVLNVDRTTPRQHPFEGPEVNDDLPEKVTFATGGFVSGDASTSMVAGDAGYVIPTGTPVFSGKRVDDDYDVTIRSFVPAAEVPEEIEVFIDVDDIVSQVYTAIGEDFPYLAELFKVKREEHEVRRNTSITDPLPEGEWDLGEDTAGDDDV